MRKDIVHNDPVNGCSEQSRTVSVSVSVSF
ncbi:MAG: hypothetical protein QG608_840 [Actinomycetota bacterium]|nr:hypothetical protein [Actinomycetota bacterium]